MKKRMKFPCEFPPATGVRGHLGMVLCWWWSEQAPEGHEIDEDEEWVSAAYGVTLIDDLMAGNTDDWDSADWWLFYDALGQVDNRTPELEEIYQEASKHVFENSGT